MNDSPQEKIRRLIESERRREEAEAAAESRARQARDQEQRERRAAYDRARNHRGD